MKKDEAVIRKVLKLEGILCAGCGAKIEEEVKKMDGVAAAYIDFVSGKLIIDAVQKHNMEQIIQKAIHIVKKIEPDVNVAIEGRENNSKEEVGVSKGAMVKLARLGVGILLFLMAVIFEFRLFLEIGLYFISYLLVGGDILLRAAKNIMRGQVFDENFLMSTATVGAFAIKEYPEAVAVMLFYQVGEFFQELAVNRSRKSIKELMNIKPEYANLQVDHEIRQVSPEEVRVGERVVVKPGEKIPLDGIVVEGISMLDTSALTGESVPRKAEPGGEVFSGVINQSGVLTIEVTKTFGDSTVAKILDLIENASGKKAPTEHFITKFAKYYTPVVIYTAVALAVVPPLLIEGAELTEWLYRALIFLVISCPCALVVSIPLSFFGGIGGASKKGILVKGGNYLEALNNVDTVVFDKTGTLTKGIFKVSAILPQNHFTKDELLEYAAYAESFSNHPIAGSIQKEYGKEVDTKEVEGYEEISGLGIRATVKGKKVLAGNAKLMEKENISVEGNKEETVVYIAVDGQFAGSITISDKIKSDSFLAMEGLRKIGVGRLVMLTGDNQRVADEVARKLALDEVYAELLPHQKVEKLESLEQQQQGRGKLIFVGDGINDAPVLARADVGVAMGGLGSDAAIEAADVVLMTDEPSKLVQAIKIAKKTRHIVWQNIILALGIKVIVLLMGAFGVATMWEAVFADVGVALIAVLNAMRVLRN